MALAREHKTRESLASQRVCRKPFYATYCREKFTVQIVGAWYVYSLTISLDLVWNV